MANFTHVIFLKIYSAKGQRQPLYILTKFFTSASIAYLTVLVYALEHQLRRTGSPILLKSLQDNPSCLRWCSFNVHGIQKLVYEQKHGQFCSICFAAFGYMLGFHGRSCDSKYKNYFGIPAKLCESLDFSCQGYIAFIQPIEARICNYVRWSCKLWYLAWH